MDSSDYQDLNYKNKEEHILVMCNICSSFIQLKRPFME